jgi:hypothetical protein
MTDSDGEPEQDLSKQVADLRQTLEELESEVDRDSLLRLPTPRGLLRFTSEVTIPAILLVLRTNIETLRLLQRTLRMADGRDTPDTIGSRAESVASTALSQLDETLSNLQNAVEGRADDSRAQDLLDDARGLRGEIEQSLDESDGTAGDRRTVDIDVDEELRSIKEDLDDGDSGPSSG